MKVKLDEDLSASLGGILASQGHQVATVPGQGWGGVVDSSLWPKLQAERIYFVTADKGFGDLRSYPPGSHAGILVLRPERESLLEFRRLLQHVLAKHRLESLAGCVTVASFRSIRVRRKPLP
jgi:hypothetical protein